MGTRALRPLRCSLTLRYTPACALLNRRQLSQSIPLLADGTTGKAFSNTLLLPKTSFPLRSDPSKAKFRKKTCEDLYRWQWDNAKGPLFVCHDGPPYANGHIHMGHALNKIIKDIINRYHVSLGHRVHYVPGWDCHGLPIENKALQDLGESSLTLSPVQIRSAARQTALQQIEVQKAEFKQLGIMADWDGSAGVYRTLDPKYEMRQLKVFQRMVEKGLIHRNHRPVYYSPSSRSALAEAELIYTDAHVSHSVYVSFMLDMRDSAFSNKHAPDSMFWMNKLGWPYPDDIACVDSAATGVKSIWDLEAFQERKGKVGFLVWTTTPWTLSANMGIAVNPNLTYSILERTGSTSVDEPRLLVVACDRVDALKDVIGPHEEIDQIMGEELVGVPYLPLFSPLCPSEVDSSTNQQVGGDADTVLRIIPASYVTADSGTGLVHCAPAHGVDDYNTFRDLQILPAWTSYLRQNVLCHVDGAGKFVPEIADVVGKDAAKELVGKDVLTDGGKAMVELLRGMGEEVLHGVEKIKHRYPYDWKTGEPVIVTATSQWFANLDGIKDDAQKALQAIKFFPEISRNRLESFIHSRSEWCISRQRVWGVPIPALYHLPTDRVVLDTESLSHIINILESKGKGVEYWWEGPVEEFVPPKLLDETGTAEWRKGADTMDVWFDSGTSWSMLEGMADSERDERNFLADVCLEGSDQHRGWFQSQLLTAVGSVEGGKTSSLARAGSPYGTLITHGMVLDEKGKKMSKSIGNVVSPMGIINGGKDQTKEPAFGTDVLRLWAATVDYWRDMPIGSTILAQAAESLRKIRNSARFILGNIGSEESRRGLERIGSGEMALAERYVMHELYKLENIAHEGYMSYNFPKVINALSNFANITLSSLYFDITKDCLYADDVKSRERRAVVTVLEQILATLTSVMAPILPYLAEEIHHASQGVREDMVAGSSVFMRTWIPLSSEWKDHEAEKDMNHLLHVRSAVLGLIEKARGNKQLKSSLEAEVDLILPSSEDGTSYALELLQREEDYLKTLFIVSGVCVTDEGSLGTSSPEWLYSDSMSIPGCQSNLGIRVRPATLSKCPRCWTFTRENDTVCGRCANVINL